MTKIHSSIKTSSVPTDFDQNPHQYKSLKIEKRDTISSAALKEKPLFTPSKPHLSPESRVIHASDKLYQAGERQLSLHTDQLQQEHGRLEQLCRENIKKMEEAAKRTQKEGVWSYLQKIGCSILSAVS